MKNKILWVLVSLLVIASLSACAPAAASDPYPAFIPQVSATGTGKVFLTPDVAYISIGVRAEANEVSAALALNNNKSQAVANAIRELGVDAKDIQTTAFNVYPQQQYGPNGEMTGTLYVVENMVYITVNNLQSMGQLLDAVVRAGANNINSIQFDVKDKSQALNQARKMAIDDAMSQAKLMAEAAGVKLVRLTSLNVYTSGNPVPVYEGKGGVMMNAAGQAPISAGQLILTVDANLSYEIK